MEALLQLGEMLQPSEIARFRDSLHGRTRRGRTSAARQSIPTRKLAFEVDGPTGQNAANGLYQFELFPFGFPLPLSFASFDRRGFYLLEHIQSNQTDLGVRSRTCAWY